MNISFNKISRDKINSNGIRGILRDFLIIIINSVVLFVSAGTIRWAGAWIYIGLILAHQTVITLLLLFINPRLLNERGKAVKKDTIPFDRVFVIVYPFMTLILSATAGISAVRFGWANLSWIFIIPGIVLFIFSSFFGSWAILANRYFESTIIVREDSSHMVCKAGPYRFVRHPGYLAWIIGALGYPLILGIAVCYIPVGLLITLFVIRTWFEDNTLKKKLAGYRLYAEETRYRLVPFIW